ncbi:MAG: ABC transporter substrate-binding protein [Lachnospiraceae bacterium]|nr:ABC transporter substrate-binding protein [Lachnospiraceae bacterium]
MKKNLLCVFLAGIMSASLLTGCGSSSNTTGGSTTDSKSAITIGVKSDLTSLNPHNHNDTISAYATRHIYSNLIRLTEDNEFVGDLADTWEYTDDTTVAFTLKEGVKFQNGSVLTSEDVKYSLESQKESAKVGHLVSMIDSVEVVDDTHFIIHLNTPSNALISSLSHSGCAILNKAYVEEQLAAGKKIEDAPIGTGPYKFAEWVPGASFTLEKNEDYFDADRKAQNDKLIFKAIPEESARTIALENGELDMLIDVSTNDAGKIRDNSSLALDEYASTRIEYFTMNEEKAPFDDVRVRQAINHAIKKDDIVVATINNEGSAFDNYIGEAAIGYYDTITKYDYNPEKAKELLAEAGVDNGFTFTCFVSNDERARSATIVQANLAELGITMNIEQMEASTFYERTGNGEHDACMAGWVANAEPDNTYRPLFTSANAGAGGNRSFYKNPEVDALVDDAATNRDKDAVAKDYQTVLETISADAIWTPLYSPRGMVARNKDLQGFTPSPIMMHNFYNLHY